MDNKKGIGIFIVAIMVISVFGVVSTNAQPDPPEIITELTTENPYVVLVPMTNSGVVHWDFEITNPNQKSYPGGEAYYVMRITNAQDSTDRLYPFFYITFDPGLPIDYGHFYWDINWDDLSEGIAPGETYVGPFGHFVWHEAVPIDYVQGGDMGAVASSPADPSSIKVPYTCTIVSPPAVPTLTPIGIIALVGLLSVVAAMSIRTSIKKRRR